MSVIPPENPRYEDQVVVVAITQRDVNTQYGTKPIFEVKTQDGRVLSTFKDDIAKQAYNLAMDQTSGQPVGGPLRVTYTEKPSSDPSKYPPNLQLESIAPANVAATPPPQAPPQAAPAAQTFSPGPTTTGPAAAQPAPVPQAFSGSGPSEDDKAHMRRSAAIKAAAVYSAGTGADLWQTAHEMMQYIENGSDPVPFATIDRYFVQ